SLLERVLCAWRMNKQHTELTKQLLLHVGKNHSNNLHFVYSLVFLFTKSPISLTKII
ncbi:hypothetical protein L9F63_020530, partial [Diploptera punctata]